MPPKRPVKPQQSAPKKRSLSAEHKAKLAAGRKQKAEAKVRAEQEARQKRLRQQALTIDERLEKAERQYAEALDRACRTKGDIGKAFDLADRRMHALLGLLALKRTIERELG